MPLSSGTKLGPYEILESVGAGGMGEVYRARDSRLGRIVAIKVLSAESTSKAERVVRFEQEAKAASARNHPNILTIYDIGESNGTRYMAMEFVEGETVRDLLRRGPVPLLKALDIAAQAAGALASAHAAGIVHRDIKPENIMVRPDGYVKVLDFGLAKLAEAPLGESAGSNSPTVSGALTEPGRILGTWLYMSPEQARGQELDARTDVWSLGAVLYEMLTDKSPFADKTLSDTLAAILHRQPAPASELRPEVPAELDRILAKALAKERDERYQGIQDMTLDLRQLRKELDSNSAFARSRAASAPSPPMNANAIPQPAPVHRSRRGKRAGLTMGLIAAISLIAVALLIAAVIGRKPNSSTPPQTPAPPQAPSTSATPERQLSYSLIVQKMRDGKPYQEPFRATGREIFENGWKVKFDFSLPQAGSLYLLNDGPGANGKPALALVFPTPSVNNGSAQVMAYQNLQSGWLVFNDSPGREKFWIVSADKPLADLEQAVTQIARSKNAVISDPQLDSSIRQQLATAPASQPRIDGDSKLTTVSSRGDLLVSELELEHR